MRGQLEEHIISSWTVKTPRVLEGKLLKIKKKNGAPTLVVKILKSKKKKKKNIFIKMLVSANIAFVKSLYEEAVHLLEKKSKRGQIIFLAVTLRINYKKCF